MKHIFSMQLKHSPSIRLCSHITYDICKSEIMSTVFASRSKEGIQNEWKMKGKTDTSSFKCTSASKPAYVISIDAWSFKRAPIQVYDISNIPLYASNFIRKHTEFFFWRIPYESENVMFAIKQTVRLGHSGHFGQETLIVIASLLLLAMTERIPTRILLISNDQIYTPWPAYPYYSEHLRSAGAHSPRHYP